MESYYEINVSLNGRHLFATAPRSAIKYADAQRIYKELERRFPAREGFEISATLWKASGVKAVFD